MKFATPISTSVKTLCLGAAMAVLLPLPLSAQVLDEGEPDAMDVARAPLDDFNIDQDDIPEVLVVATKDPYADEGLTTCNDIVAQIASLDAVLGADFDIAEPTDRGITVGSAAKTIVGSFVPFRRVVREVSGANKRRRALNVAITAGMVRRGYLKGMGQQRSCSYPARPREGQAQASE